MIKKVASLANSDIKNIRTDPMLLLAFIGPLILIVVYHTGIPVGLSILESQFNVDMRLYEKLVFLVFLFMLPLITGMLGGFLMLEEKESQLITYYSITPLGQKGYVLFRLTVPFLITFVSVLLFMKFSHFSSMPIIWFIFTAIITSMLAPLISLFLASFATTRVDGFALSKMSSLLIVAPFILFLVPSGMQWIGGVLLTFWITKLFQSAWSNPSEFIVHLVVSLCAHLIVLLFLCRRFSRQIA
ncbi:hypothetical protein [Sporosarcina sp. Te-1]|uniref:hypothetical protein n=1 Tax=Sporosarcina sp. Te-1 TaxID=2818390 RepID=UPI001A9DC675|nr:hypothetical protein [Sporosarcina sp. Te-1]QTD43114.1 hypothetical protein J3U78_10410 [Sporosarcina sp. Te-1]